MSLVEGSTLRNDVAKDEAISYKDLEIPANRVCDHLRREQDKLFFGEAES